MATAFRLDQWRQIESADSGAESGSEELLGRWSDRSLKGEKMHVRYDELNLEDFVNATKPL